MKIFANCQFFCVVHGVAFNSLKTTALNFYTFLYRFDKHFYCLIYMCVAVMYSQSWKLQLHIEHWFCWSILCNGIECNRIESVAHKNNNNNSDSSNTETESQHGEKVDAKFWVSLMVECIAKSFPQFVFYCVLFSTAFSSRSTTASIPCIWVICTRIFKKKKKSEK